MLPVTVGSSALGTAADPAVTAALADAILRSPIKQVDTSNAYAAGRSEVALGAAIGRAGGVPADFRVFSKADADPITGALDGERIKRSFEESLTRLGLERLPVYHLHDPSTVTPSEAAGPGGAIEALTSLRDQGLVGAIGIATGRRELVHEYLQTEAFDAVLTHNRYTLADRSAESILREASARSMTVFNAAPFGGGLLAAERHAEAKYAYRPAAPAVLAYVERVREFCQAWRVSLAAAALHFSLSEPRIHSTVVGVSTAQRLADLERLVETPIPEGFFGALAELGEPPGAGLD